MADSLRVSNASVRSAAADCMEVAGKLSSATLPSSSSGLPCQPSTAAIGTLLADAEAARTALATRMQDTSTEVASAGAAYVNTDADGAAKLDQQLA